MTVRLYKNAHPPTLYCYGAGFEAHIRLYARSG